jgi:tRNA-specific adenosine deaminase 2
MLLYNKVGHVFYGCGNPRFGGNGTVADVSSWPLEGSDESSEAMNDEEKAEVSCKDDPVKEGRSSWRRRYCSEGGHGSGEAIRLLQAFYEQENTGAPEGKRRRKEPAAVS